MHWRYPALPRSASIMCVYVHCRCLPHAIFIKLSRLDENVKVFTLAANKVLHCRLRTLLLTKNQYSVYACNALQRCQAWNSLSGVFNLVTNWLLTLVGRTEREKLLWYDSFTVSCAARTPTKCRQYFSWYCHTDFGFNFVCMHRLLRQGECGRYDGEQFDFFLIGKNFLSSLSAQRNCVWAIFHHLSFSPLFYCVELYAGHHRYTFVVGCPKCIW